MPEIIYHTGCLSASQHIQEWTQGSGVSEAIASLNIESLTEKELNERINPQYPIKTGGWWCRGVNWRNGQPMGLFYGQGKPDKLHLVDPAKGKTAKYMTATGMEPDAIFLAMTDKDYWAKVYADESIIRVWTEGAKKAAAGLTLLLATIALTGVWNWGKGGKLAPEVERWAQPGTKHVIAFDSDYVSKPSCRQAIIQFAKLLTARGCEVLIATWPKEWKGMDDYIVANGGDAFKEAIANAQTVKQWEKQFTKKDQQTGKSLSPRRSAQVLAERYRSEWKYDLGQNTWRHCNGKIWPAVHKEVFIQMVYRQLETMPEVSYENFAYVENVVRFLQTELLEAEWNTFDRMKWIAFKDCVYEVETGKRHEHAPGFGFISCLEHDFPELVVIDPASSLLDQLRITAPTFWAWAMHSQKGDPLKVLKLLAIINGVIKFRFFELQMFVHLCGVPGAGKGTFARLLEAIVGKSNHSSARLPKLGEDYTIANIINYQLVVCPDEKKYVGDWGGLLSLTGGDTISYREIYKPESKGKFYGTIVVLSNSAIFAGDTTGIERRLCLMTFDVPLIERDPAIEARMQKEVPALTALSLGMPDQQVTDLLRGTGSAVIPDFKRSSWLHKTENDSVALFMEERLVRSSAESYVTVGNKSSDIYTLYGAYVRLCEDNNSKTLFTANNFRNRLLEFSRDLGWDEARETRQRDNQYRIYGVRLREQDDEAPRISEILGQCVPVCTPCVSSVYSPEPLENMGCVRCVEENDRSSRMCIESASENKSIIDESCPENLTHLHTPCNDDVSAITHPLTQPHTPIHTELIIGVGRKADYCGEVVTIVGWENRGTKVQIEFSNRRMQYVKRGSLKAPACKLM
ncbi:DUF3854 domain-containing protein (plasmid) [Nostoc sp. UHCC 0926]|uniref:DUF3854 domain-containing protein n=1 Tax=Nostoc sp. UHCC 0926 TaxID=3025190 RepID=UPI002360A5D1|nr:DUF3854 domain-containing protein [Nostoc sp. UHCC 0926]WDD30133.1 DUF3854 domain-containing protein [Nostoc sp. UHCC 0926]